MRGRVARCGLAAVLLAITVLCSGPAVAEQTQIPPEEYAALVALYEATDGANWTNKWTLPTDDPCGLYGVTCEGGHVTRIALGNNNLVGAIPPAIGDLVALKYLFLGDCCSPWRNSLAGIPAEIANLTNLETLIVEMAGLSGQIPPEIGNMASLKSLDLAYNDLAGGIPEELGDLANLTRLSLQSNNLSGSIPPQLGNLTNLTHLSLADNWLDGTIPSELGDLSSLEGLKLYYNYLAGEIPSEIGNLVRLRQLDLSVNLLGGVLPSSFAQLHELGSLRMDYNMLVGPLPPELANLTGLSDLDLGYNKLWSDDAALTVYLDAKDADWAATQTIPPSGLVATVVEGGAHLTWEPIAYTADDGGYQFHLSTTSGGPYTGVAATSSKLVTETVISGLEPGATYYLVAQTFTHAHGLQRSFLLSPLGEEVSFTTTPLPVAPIAVSIGGPPEGMIDTSYTFSATVSPEDVTMPLAHTWSPTPVSGQGTPTATYVWSNAGTQTINLTVSNAAGSASASHTIAITVPPAAVAITGPTEGSTGAAQSFLAAVSPANATAPLTYTWSPPHERPGTAQATYTWAEAGEKAVTVSVEGSGATVTATHTFLALSATTGATSPEAGGTLSAEEREGQSITVEVPAGAVTETVTLAYAPLEAPPEPEAPSGFRFAGRRFTLNTYRDGERLEGVQFAAPVTVTLAYTDAEVEGLDESTLVLHTWDGSSWVDAATSCSPASTYLREPEENRLSVGICHLSEFAVFGRQPRLYLPLTIR